ncbi:Protein phosphatase methylesterase 1 [Venturia inaequalis]|nr:Protein phosphatase methylesterase 1 [Venturia inaequalis]
MCDVDVVKDAGEAIYKPPVASRRACLLPACHSCINFFENNVFLSATFWFLLDHGHGVLRDEGYAHPMRPSPSRVADIPGFGAMPSSQRQRGAAFNIKHHLQLLFSSARRRVGLSLEIQPEEEWWLELRLRNTDGTAPVAYIMSSPHSSRGADVFFHQICGGEK